MAAVQHSPRFTGQQARFARGCTSAAAVVTLPLAPCHKEYMHALPGMHWGFHLCMPPHSRPVLRADGLDQSITQLALTSSAGSRLSASTSRTGEQVQVRLLLLHASVHSLDVGLETHGQMHTTGTGIALQALCCMIALHPLKQTDWA